MSSTEPTDDAHVHALTGAYALDALDPLERARVDRHLERCAMCAAEVRSFTETAARLGGGAATTSPPGLKDRVLAEAARTRQLPPAVQPLPVRRTVPPTTRWLAVAAAALLVLSVSLGAVAWSQYREAEQMRLAAAAMTDVLADPGRQMIDADFAEGHGTVVLSGERVVLVGDGVGVPPEGRAYQLWFIGEDGPRPSVMLSPAGDGRFWADATGIEPGEAVGVTVEPAEGSQQPTTEPVLVAQTAKG
jgi:anti-sigma-K factor RskA